MSFASSAIGNLNKDITKIIFFTSNCRENNQLWKNLKISGSHTYNTHTHAHTYTHKYVLILFCIFKQQEGMSIIKHYSILKLEHFFKIQPSCQKSLYPSKKLKQRHRIYFDMTNYFKNCVLALITTIFLLLKVDSRCQLC